MSSCKIEQPKKCLFNTDFKLKILEICFNQMTFEKFLFFRMIFFTFLHLHCNALNITRKNNYMYESCHNK